MIHWYLSRAESYLQILSILPSLKFCCLLELTLFLICLFYALPVQQQIKIWWQKYGQMGMPLSDWVEHIVGKGEIPRYRQFLLFPQCFQKQSVVDVLKRVSMESRVKHLLNFNGSCWKEYCTVYWLKELLESINRCTGCRDISKILLKMALDTIQSINYPFTILEHWQILTLLMKSPLENIVGKGENAGNQHFLLFPQSFLALQKEIASFEPKLHYRLQILSIWTRINFFPSGKGLVRSSYYILFSVTGDHSFKHGCFTI